MNTKAFIRRLKTETDPVRRGNIMQMELRFHGYTLAAVARSLGKSFMGVKHAVVDDQKSERIQTHIAGLLGVDRAELWPRRYKDDKAA
ncbi:MAG: helix-turn-helix domain-containing protein [Nitrospirae bacterium]|nr:helix-turn-helix domain-containing protein [Nitrospirota bacterium]